MFEYTESKVAFAELIFLKNKNPEKMWLIERTGFVDYDLAKVKNKIRRKQPTWTRHALDIHLRILHVM